MIGQFNEIVARATATTTLDFDILMPKIYFRCLPHAKMLSNNTVIIVLMIAGDGLLLMNYRVTDS